MRVTLSGIFVVEQPAIKVLLFVSMMAWQLLRESKMGLSSATVIAVMLLQQLKAPSPMLVTLLGIVIEVKLVHLRKA